MKYTKNIIVIFLILGSGYFKNSWSINKYGVKRFINLTQNLFIKNQGFKNFLKKEQLIPKNTKKFSELVNKKNVMLGTVLSGVALWYYQKNQALERDKILILNAQD